MSDTGCMATEPAGGRGRPRSTAAHAAILAATRDLLAEVGWAGLTMGAVAERAGVAKTTVYRRWSTKADLVVDTVADIFDELAMPSGGPVLDDIAATIRLLADVLSRRETQAGFLALITESADDPELKAKARANITDRQRRLVEVGKERAVAERLMPADADTGLIFDVVAGTLFHRVVIAGEPIDDSYIERLIGFVLGGLDNLSGAEHAPG